MSSDSKSKLNLPIYDQAAEWLIELREGEVDAGTRERLDAWFRASPEHIRAYLELSSIWDEGADPDLDRTHGIQDLIERARATSNVIPLGASVEPRPIAVESSAQSPEPHAAPVLNDRSATQAPEDDSPDHRHGTYHRFWRRRPVWIAAAVSACVIGSLSLYLYGERNRTIATDTGEQRFVSLVDGSTVELNSRSRVRVRYSDNERDVDLLEGQALFRVAHDTARPFIVHSGTTLVRAVGTQFDVYRKESGTTVTVVEGRVAVLSPMLAARSSAVDPTNVGSDQTGSIAAPQHVPPSALARDSSSNLMSPKVRPNSQFPAPAAGVPNSALTGPPALQGSDPSGSAVYLSAGEQITVSSGAPPRATHADPTVATAWTQHELVFESTPLNEVAQDFNRYNTRQLIVSDPALKGFHITGVFSSADPASLLKFLRAQRDLVVQETDDGIRVSKK